MTPSTIPKALLVSRLKHARCDSIDMDNEARMWYQLGRNSVTDILLVELACGDLDGGM